MTELQKLGITALAFLIVAVPAGLICLAVWRLLPAGARRLLPWPRWRPVPWDALEVFVAFLILFVTPTLVYMLLDQAGFFPLIYGQQAEEPSLLERKYLWVAAFTLPVQVGLIVSFFRLLHGARPAQLGLTCRRGAQNLVAGYLSYLVLTPPILLLYWVILQFFKPQPHLLERLARAQLLDVEWILIVLMALVAAPLLEELLFRGVLLPWQMNQSAPVQVAVGAAALGVSMVPVFFKATDFHLGPMLFVAAMLPGYLLIPYLLRRCGRWKGRQEGGGAAEGMRVNVGLALYGNALLFAAFHSAAWPSPIALAPLSFGLGWLAYRTRSLVGPMVTHALFNGVATLTLFLE